MIPIRLQEKKGRESKKDDHHLTDLSLFASRRFSIKNEGKQYSALWPVLCTNTDGDVTEVHYNNRTMKPLQAPTHVVTPFYQAYRVSLQLFYSSGKGSLWPVTGSLAGEVFVSFLLLVLGTFSMFLYMIITMTYIVIA